MPSPPQRAARWLIGFTARAGIWLVNLLPEQLALRVGALLGRLLAVLRPRWAEVARVNLRIAFPEWSETRRRRVLQQAFANLGRGLAEIARIRRLSPETVRKQIRVEGLEHLEAARRTSPVGGVIVLTGHFGNWELLATAMSAHGLPVTLVHRARDNPHLDSLVQSWRQSFGLELIERGSAARNVLRALRSGRFVALPLDQNTNPREGIFVPFFHRLACTRDGPARIAMRTGAPVVPVCIRWIEGGTRHLVRIGTPLELRPAGDDRDAAIRDNVRRMNRAIEAMIRSAPDQWSWTHRRWRSQPRGEARAYRSRRAPGPLRSLLGRCEILT